MKDEEAIRRMYEGFAMCGLVMRGSMTGQEIVYVARKLADAMINMPMDDDEEDTGGLAALKKKRYARD
jgi:hypothetical protein